MKKKVLLTLIPALMVLGSCAGNAPQAKEQLFQEDTLLHDEIFGSAASLFGKAKRNALPEDDSSAIPAIGVQKAIGETTVSVRFVAATNFEKDTLENTEAVWTRTMYDASGNVFKESTEKASLLTYDALRDGSGTRYTIDDFNTQYETNYKSFVVYTMLNIPKTTYDNYYLNAYLTVTPSGEESAYSQTLATNVAGTKRISFAYNAEGYFLKGTLNGNAGTFYPQEASTPEGNNARFVFNDFKANDTFFIGYNHIDATPSNSKFTILDSSCLSLDNPYFVDDGSTSHKIKSVSTHAYSFNINSSNQLADIENGYTVTYTNNSDASVTVPLVYDGVDLSEKNQFTATIAPKTDSALVFKYDGNTISPSGEDGANVHDGLIVTCGGPDIGLWLKDQGSSLYSVWVGYSNLITATVNGEPIELTNIKDPYSSNIGEYNITLNQGDSIIFNRGYVSLEFPDYDYSTSFVSQIDGVHTFYLNSEYKMYVSEPVADIIVNIWSKINIEDSNVDKPAYAWIFTNNEDGAWYPAAHVAEEWETTNNRHYTVNVGSVIPTNKKIVFVVFKSVTGDTPNWDDKIVQSSDGTIAYSGGSYWVNANAA